MLVCPELLHAREMLAESHGRAVLMGAPTSDINRFNIISTKACCTHWTLAVTTLSNFLYTRVAEKVVASRNDYLKKGQAMSKQKLRE